MEFRRHQTENRRCAKCGLAAPTEERPRGQDERSDGTQSAGSPTASETCHRGDPLSIGNPSAIEEKPRLQKRDSKRLGGRYSEATRGEPAGLQAHAPHQRPSSFEPSGSRRSEPGAAFPPARGLVPAHLESNFESLGSPSAPNRHPWRSASEGRTAWEQCPAQTL